MSDKEAETNLQGAFGDMGSKQSHVDYSHPMADELLTGIKNQMNKIKTGYGLLGVPEAYGYNIRVLKGKADPGVSSEHKIIYIHIPAKQTEVLPKQILDLTKAIRLAEQDVMGFTTPDPSKDIFEHASVVHAKNLDSIVCMCRLIKDLENTDLYPIFIDTLEKMGHIAIYKEFMSGSDAEKLSDTYHGE